MRFLGRPISLALRELGEKSTIQNGEKSIRMGTLIKVNADTWAKRNFVTGICESGNHL